MLGRLSVLALLTAAALADPRMAAGLAASLCVRRKCQPRELPVSLVQDALRRDAVNLGMGGTSQDALKAGASAPPRDN